MTMPNGNQQESSSEGRSSSHTDSPEPDDQVDGGPGSHTEDATGGVTNDPASGGVPEGADDSSPTQSE